MDERYRTLAAVVVTAAITATVCALAVPHGWPLPASLLIVIAVVVALPLGWMARRTLTAIAAAAALGVVAGGPFIAPIALTLIAIAATAMPTSRRS